jgi:hypothetical protein
MGYSKLLAPADRFIQYPTLMAIVVIAIGIRWVSADFQVLFDADPWWFYRHALEIYTNNLEPLRWDMQSHYPPGRPVDYPLGWSYTLAFFYALLHPLFPGLTLMKFSGLFVAVFASIVAVPAYFVGRIVTNRWGGLVTAAFAVTIPVFIDVSLAGYPDSDAAVVFYTWLAVLVTLFAVRNGKKIDFESSGRFFASLLRYLPYLVPPLLVYWLFALNWHFSWYIYFIFLLFIPFLILARFLESKIFYKDEGYASLAYRKIRDNRSVIVPIVMIGLVGEPISFLTRGWPFNTVTPHIQLVGGLSFIGVGILETSLLLFLSIALGAIIGLCFSKLKGLAVGSFVGALLALLLIQGIAPHTLLVSERVAELQPLQVSLLDSAGIIARIGSIPVLLGLIGIVGIILFKLLAKIEIKNTEYFAVIWIIATMFLVSSGERFSLLLSIAVAAASGFVIGNFVELTSKRKNMLVSTAYGLIFGALFIHVFYSAAQAEEQAELLQVSQNWVEALEWLKQNADTNSLVVSWWDQGHLIAGFTGLRVHTDGAHCDPSSCIPYDLNIRIVDAGRIYSTSNEQEAVSLLNKYRGLSSEQCENVKMNFGTSLPSDNSSDSVCHGVSDIYLVASADLIPKYPSISYYGSFDHSTKSGISRRYVVAAYTEDTDGSVVYGSGAIRILKENDLLMPIVNIPGRGIEDSIVSQLILYDDEGKEIFVDLSDLNEGERLVEGLVWIPPDGALAFFMESEVRDSLLTKLFFFEGRDLKEFELIFQNIEVKIFKLKM